MKKINILVSLFMVFILYCSLSIWGEIGIIRDEYGITGDGISFTLAEMIWMIIVPFIMIIFNLAMIFQKNEVKRGIKYSVIIISVFVSLVSALSLTGIRGSLNDITAQTSQAQDLKEN